MIRFHNPLQACMKNVCKQACNNLSLSKQDRDSGERLKLQNETRLDVRTILWQSGDRDDIACVL